MLDSLTDFSTPPPQKKKGTKPNLDSNNLGLPSLWELAGSSLTVKDLYFYLRLQNKSELVPFGDYICLSFIY